MPITTQRERLDGQLINLAVGAILRVPAKESPSKQWWHYHAKQWRKRQRGFRISIKRAGNDVLVIRVA